jgi:diguanylate cyclase (GGDEF)-like protein
MPLIQCIDDELLSVLQDFLSGITDQLFAIYDSQGALLVPPKSQDFFTTWRESYASGREEYEKFIRGEIDKAVMRKNPSLFRDAVGEYRLFIPVTVNDRKLVFVSGAFSPGRTVCEAMSAHIKYLMEIFLKSNYTRNLYNKNYRRIKALTDILAGIQLPASKEKVYSSVLDTILLLFDVDTVSIMVLEKDIFRTSIASGRLRHVLMSFSLGKSNSFIAQSVEAYTPVFNNNVEEMCELGLPDKITSIYVFPFSCKGVSYKLLVLYNAILSNEESQLISEVCKLVTFVLVNIDLQDTYHQGIAGIEGLDMAVKQHDADALCETILGRAMEMVEAEKGSLMVHKENNLVIKAVQGINRWLVQDMMIKKGEGIAGKVFKDGKPFFIKNLNDMTLPDFKPKSRYKTASFISMPFTFGSETIGVLNITDKRTGEEFTERDFYLIKQFAFYTSFALKISADYALAEQMKKQSVSDSLTGLFNRQHFLKRFREEIQRAELYPSVFSIALVDIDDFRLFNDIEGYSAGNSVLTEIAKIAHECIRTYDILSRFGGEEFGILMPHTDNSKAYVAAERIRNNVKASLMNRWTTFPRPGVTVSIGIASFPRGGNNIDELIESADTALYKAKSTGKDKTVVYSLLYDGAENANAT